MTKAAIKDSELVVGPKDGSIVARTMKLKRKAAAEKQLDNLRSTKAALVDAEVISIMVETMQEALAAQRTERIALTIELVLALVRNLLAIPDAPESASPALRQCCRQPASFNGSHLTRLPACPCQALARLKPDWYVRWMMS